MANFPISQQKYNEEIRKGLGSGLSRIDAVNQANQLLLKDTLPSVDKTADVGDVVNQPEIPAPEPPKPYTAGDDILSGVKNLMGEGGIFDTSVYDDLSKQYQDFYTKQEADAEARRDFLEQERTRRLAQVDRLFGEQQRRLEKQQAEGRKTQDVVSFRLGTTGTQYGADTMKDLIEQQNFQMEQLQDKKQEAINKINSAIDSENFDLAEQLRQSYKDMLDQESKLRQQQQTDYVQAVNTALNVGRFDLSQQQEERSQYEFAQEQAQTLAENLANSFITFDEQGNITDLSNDNIIELAQEKGIPVETLTSAINQQKQVLEEVKRDIAEDELKNIKSSYQTLNGRRVLTTINEKTGEVLRQTDLGGAYKPTTGGGTTDADKQIAKIQSKATSLLEDYAKGDVEWGEMYDIMKINFPDMPSDAINELLGGGIPYNPETGAFDTERAWGRAIAREEE